jgi:hypothetical protein
LPVIAPIASNCSVAINAATVSTCLRLATVLRATSLFTALLLTTLSLLSRLPLSLLAFFSLLSLLLTLLLALLLSLLLIPLLLPLLLPVAARGSFIETPSQRIQTVSQLPCSIEILFGTRTVCTARALLGCLKSLRDVIQTTLDRALISATGALLLTLLTLLTIQ